MAELIYVDAEGNELSRKVKGKGRPPRGAVKQDNGDFIVSPVADAVRFTPEYITFGPDGEIAVELKDADGNLVSRLAKGRGRPKPGFTKLTEGEYAGHWTKVFDADGNAVDETVVATVVEDSEAESEAEAGDEPENEVTVTVTETDTVTDPAATV
jgi:hypothetical protein